MDGWMDGWMDGCLEPRQGRVEWFEWCWTLGSTQWRIDFFFPKKPFLNGELRRLLCIKILIFGMLISTISK